MFSIKSTGEGRILARSAPMTTLGPEEQLTRRSGIEARSLPNGTLLVDLNTGRCFRLNHVGAEVWSLLATPATQNSLCAMIADRYRAPLLQAREDIGALLGQLLSDELIQRVAGDP